MSAFIYKHNFWWYILKHSKWTTTKARQAVHFWSQFKCKLEGVWTSALLANCQTGGQTIIRSEKQWVLQEKIVWSSKLNETLCWACTNAHTHIWVPTEWMAGVYSKGKDAYITKPGACAWMHTHGHMCVHTHRRAIRESPSRTFCSREGRKINESTILYHPWDRERMKERRRRGKERG